MKNPDISAMIEMTEEARRMQDMLKMYGAMGLGSLGEQAEETLVLNQSNSIVTYILEHPEEEKTSALAQQIMILPG